MAMTLLDSLKQLLAITFFGTVFTTMLFGISSLQIFHYFSRYRKDPLLEKCLVGLTWFLVAGHLAVTLYIAYYSLVSAWTNPIVMLDPMFSRAFQHQMTLMMLLIMFLHTLYGIMAWKLSCHVHWAITYLIWFVIGIGHGIGIFAIIEAYKFDIHQGPKIVHNFVEVFGATAFYAGFASAMAVDVILAVFLCFVLRKSRVEFSESKSIVSFISQYAIASGVLVSIVQVAIFITSVAQPTNFMFYALEMLLPGVHAISYLSLLHARTVFRHGIRCTKAPNMPLMVHINTLTAIARPGNRSDCEGTEMEKEKGVRLGGVECNVSDILHAHSHRSDKVSFTDSSRSVVDSVV